MSIERIILSNLVFDEEYARKVVPFLKSEYFSNVPEKIIYELINSFFLKYNSCPTIEALAIDLSKASIDEYQFAECKEIISSLVQEEVKEQWLLDNTEKFCQEKAIYNGIMKSINIMDDKSGHASKGMIPQILSDALAVSFDNHIGHDFLADADARFEFYHTKEVKIPFDLDYMNRITQGGLPKKTLNVALAGTGVGKSLFMCHCAASNLSRGFNVLYITLEMAEERIAERIDANLLGVPVDDLKAMSRENYDLKMKKLKAKTTGKLIIKEYPTASAGSANFRHLLNELKIKKNFMPDIIYIDYINICVSSRIKHGNQVNSYTLIKAIAEELRGLAVEFNVPVVSATQTTRSGFTSSDLGLEDTSESFGLPATVDFMFALIKTEELSELNQILVKQLKNRYGDPSINRRFVIGVDQARMFQYDVEQEAQDAIMKDTPVMDNTKFITEDMERSSKSKPKFDFGDFR